MIKSIVRQSRGPPPRREPTGSQVGAKWVPEGNEREPKGSQREQNGSRMEATGSQREPKGTKSEPKGCQKDVKLCLTDAKNYVKTHRNKSNNIVPKHMRKIIKTPFKNNDEEGSF